MTETNGWPKAVSLAEQIAEDVLFPAAAAVDRADTVPVAHLDLLASEGFYGIAGPPEGGQLEIPDFPTVCRVVETLAGGCLTTTFVWAQHHGAVMAAANSTRDGIRDEWLEPLAAGRRRAGLAIAAAVRPGPPALRATRVPGGYVFDGEAPWVTGWGLVDTLYAAARDADDTIIWALLDAGEGGTLTVAAMDMVVARASRTVRLRFEEYFVPDERVTGTMPHAAWAQRDPATLRFNGSLALGVAGRCCRLLGPGPLDAQLAASRDALDAAGPETLPDARAAASDLALRAAGAVAVAAGSRAVLLDEHAQRLMREATFLLVFGSRPGIRDALLRRLSAQG
jgi:alkylation response protein AidB-like acyl-CoA dehydrogenase